HSSSPKPIQCKIVSTQGFDANQIFGRHRPGERARYKPFPLFPLSITKTAIRCEIAARMRMRRLAQSLSTTKANPHAEKSNGPGDKAITQVVRAGPESY